MKIPQYVINAMNSLNQAGYECYLVGGCVRDTLMGKEPHDYDLTTSALPELMLTVFDGCKIIETGLKHGTVTLLTDGGPIEITTFRIDGEYKDNRRPENVIFTPKLSEDLARRDFTVNAIAMDKEGNLVDLYGGEKDINSKIIRCVGDPEKRFNEDGLRILRALRFASTLNFEIHPDTEKAIFKLSYLLKNISAERVREELFKLLCGVSAKAVLISYVDVILPFLQPISRVDLIHFAEIAEKLPLVAEIRMAALFALHSDIVNLKSAMQALKTSNKQIKAAENCCDIIQSPPTDPTQTALLIGQLGEKEFNLYLQTAKACEKDISVTLRMIDDLKSRNACYNLHQLALTGADLIELGIKGKKVGDMLQTLFSSVAEGKVKNEKVDLLNYVKQSIDKSELPQRKPVRLKGYDYNTPGAYFITVCTMNRKHILSSISVGTDVLGGPKNELTDYGKIAENQLLTMSNFYKDIKIDKFVIMPNHIHLLISILDTDDGQPRTSVPTKSSLISTFVSTFKRYCNKKIGTNIWQSRSFDHIIRGQKDYDEIWQYINNNPIKWVEDEFYTKNQG